MADQMKRSRHDSSPDCKLPEDVLVIVLIKLPIKSLLRFQAVSESWCSLISSTHFFKTHLHRQSVVAPNHCLLSLRADSDYVDNGEDRNDIEDLDLDLGILDLTHHYDSPVADDDILMLADACIRHYDLSILDSCNGLVCMGGRFKTDNDLILWNPATRRYRSLVVPEADEGYGMYLDFPTLGLCYVDDDFKILVWNDANHSVDIPYLYVYSLSSNSWDRFKFYARKTEIGFKSPTFMGRSMHWLSQTSCDSATEIVAFDVINRAKSCFRVPVNCSRHPLTMQQTLVIGGCLSIVIYYDTEGDGDAQEGGIGIWVMEQYGVEDSWVRWFFIQEEEFEDLKYPIVSWNNGEIVFNNDSEGSKVLIFYDPYSGEKRYVEFSSYHVLKFVKYVESLTSVKVVDELDSSGEEGSSNDSS